MSDQATIVSKIRNARGEIVYTYENDCGAHVATRVLTDHSWRVRLYYGPEEWATYDVAEAGAAERMCLDHASQF